MDSTKGQWKTYKDYVQDEDRHTILFPLTSRAYTETLANAQLTVAAVNACKAINPDNPMAAAESIKEMYEALKESRVLLSSQEWPMLRELIDKALVIAEMKQCPS